MLDPDILGAGLAEIVRAEIGLATASLNDEIVRLRAELAERPAPISAETIQRMIADAVGALPKPELIDIEGLTAGWDERVAGFQERVSALAERLDAMPTVDTEALLADLNAKATDAANAAIAEIAPTLKGEPGKDADPDAIDLMVAQAVARIPPPADGKSITVEDVAPLIESEVQKAVAAIPIPKDGVDGVGLASALIDKDGNLVVTNTRGETFSLGCVVGRDGVDAKGEPGRDALQLTDFDTELSEDGRLLTLSLENDEIKVTHELQLPTMIYRGVFKEGAAYLPGDTVTWAGSLWHCDTETADKPGEGSKAWTLAAKKGRDGKDGK